MSSPPSSPQFIGGAQSLASQAPFTSPAPLAQASSATGNVGNIATGPQVSGQANQTMAGAPSWLNLNNYNSTQNPSSPGGVGGPFNQQLMQQMSNWYLQNQVQPQVSAAQSQAQSGGQNYGSYGPAFAGQIQGEGQQQAFQAALAANQQQFQDVLGGNQAYYQGPAALSAQQGNLQVQNQLQQAALNNSMNIANMESANQYNLGSAGLQNQYNLQAEQIPNNYNLQNYGNQIAGYQAKNSAIENPILGAGMIGMGGLNAYTGLQNANNTNQLLQGLVNPPSQTPSPYSYGDYQYPSTTPYGPEAPSAPGGSLDSSILQTSIPALSSGIQAGASLFSLL